MSTPITIHQFPAAIDMQPSPFGLKLETWLRMQKLPYDVEFSPTKVGPKGKFPFATIDQKTIGDSELIIQQLQDTQNLAKDTSAQGLFIRRLAEDHLYFILVYSRWIDPAGWTSFRGPFFQSAPRLIRGMISRKIRKVVTQSLTAQGIARHNQTEVYQKAATDLQALSENLGEKPYFGENQPTETDASVYGLLANIQYSPIKGPLYDLLQNHQNLIDFCDRLKREFWPQARRGGGEETGYTPVR